MNLANYYNRFDEAKNYDTVMIRDGYAGQGAEINELQAILASKIKNMGDVLFKEGDIIQDAQLISNHLTGEVRARAGKVYVFGAVRLVNESIFIIPIDQTVQVGIYLKKNIISELEDPYLYNPAVGSEAEGEAGACRYKVEPIWGWQGQNTNDGIEGEFFPVHTLDSGIVRVKETPPQLDSVSRAIARYDKDSAGGSYVVEGFDVEMENNTEDEAQCYLVGSGRARVNGNAIEVQTSRRLYYAATPDLLTVEAETHASTGEAEQEVFTHRFPIAHVQEVRITIEKTVNLSHGNFEGCSDSLPDNAVIGIIEIKQGNTIYVQNADFLFRNGKIDWSPSGSEPATGSTYSVKYRFRSVVTPSAITEESVSVQNAADGSTVDITYSVKMPRIDRLTITGEGSFEWVKGVASDNPLPSKVPSSSLLLASVYQSWSNTRYVSCDTVKVVKMQDIMTLSDRIDWLTEHIARQELAQDVNTREAGTKKGVFVDPFTSDSMRDQGLEQNAAVVNGELVLPISSVVVGDLESSSNEQLAFIIVPAIKQMARTGSMLVNPYAAFDPMPAEVTIIPSIDNWTESRTQWTSGITQTFNSGWAAGNTFMGSSSNTNTQSLGTTQHAIEFLRQIEIRFLIKGFGSGEKLTHLTFDGIPVPFYA